MFTRYIISLSFELRDGHAKSALRGCMHKAKLILDLSCGFIASVFSHVPTS